ncbi:MAG: hydrolase [Candidatus Glassbacteria bacterium]|nr:hydrolase [Candidatus Glassbacteria bacterium]
MAQPGRLLDLKRTLLVVVDLQQRLVPVIDSHEAVVANCARLIEGCRVLGVPVIFSEQYPRGLGPTVEQLRKLAGDDEIAEKITFSCLRDRALAETVAETGRDTLLVCGVEAHVCVTQTVLDALEAGYRVHVAADATGSRSPENKRVALERLAVEGATVTTTESALFELLKKAGTDEFRQISKLVK